MLHLAIIGSGPAGYYTAEAAQKKWGDGVRIDLFDRLPVPFGLIRSGVAPDHQSIKAVARRFEAVAMSSHVGFVGNVTVGRDVSVNELRELYDAVILATGAPSDRPLDIPGSDLSNVFGSASFVGWYNGHPEFADLTPNFDGKHAVVIGNGNVALDIARILAKTPQELASSDIVDHALQALSASRLTGVTILGRRGPHQIAMTPKELGELAHLDRACPRVLLTDFPNENEDNILEPGQRKSVAMLRSFAAIPDTLRSPNRSDTCLDVAFNFFSAPRALIGKNNRVSAIEVERTRIDNGRAVGTGEIRHIPADLVVSAIGYQTSPIPCVPFDIAAGRFANDEGRIAPGVYCVGWARRGPSGTIGTNRPDGIALVDKIAEDLGDPTAGTGKAGHAGFDAIALARGLNTITYEDWLRIDAAEIARARTGAPREKFVNVHEMISAAEKP